MKCFVRSHYSGGRIKVFLKKTSVKSWYELFDNELNNLVMQHPFVDQFIWIKPNSEKLFSENLNLFNRSKYYIFEEIYPNSVFSIPFLQTAIIENNGTLISSPNTLTESNCTFSLFLKQTKLNVEKSMLYELIAVIRTPNSLYSNVLNIDKLLNLPPHMKRSTYTSFLKIELSDKSYWNDKQYFKSDIKSNYIREKYDSEMQFDSLIDDDIQGLIGDMFSTSQADSNEKCTGDIIVKSLVRNSQDEMETENFGFYKCINCRSNEALYEKVCYCDSIRKFDNAFHKCHKSLSYKTKGSGNNPFYFAIQKQFGPKYFTSFDFVGYFDTDELDESNNELFLIEKLKSILHLTGSSKAKIIPVNVEVLREVISDHLLFSENKSELKKLEFITGTDEVSTNCISFKKANFIDLKFLRKYLFKVEDNVKKIVITNSSVPEQIIEYFDILNNQNLFLKDRILVNPFDSWELRYDCSNDLNSSELDDLSESTSLLKKVAIKEAPSDMFKVQGLLRPTLINQYIWYVINQVATGNYPWSFIYLRGVSTSPISFRYKPHYIDNNSTNSINDLYLLIFREKEEIFMIFMSLVNCNDANL